MAIVERRSTSARAQVHYILGNSMSAGDLVFIGGRPVLVVSWRTERGRRVPYVCFPLEEKKLRKSARPNVYLYEGEVGTRARTGS